MAPRPLRALVIGHSHTTAIEKAVLADPGLDIVVINYGKTYEVGKRHKTLAPELAELYAPARVFTAFGGSEHSVFGLIEAPVPFDFHLDAVPGVEPGRWVVPSGMIRRTLHAAMARKMALAAGARALFGVPVAHLCSPPPFGTIDDPMNLPRVFHDKLAAGIVPARLRRKLHHVHSAIVRDFCAENGIAFLEVPPESMDAEGYLRPEFATRDPTHGNHRYGRLVLRQIMECAP
ncbi:hypothetical protein [Muricoccus radiodurans]|uniref:hypothetical protein n=1 Tax=Muricoccus radiodurans TaxID=2231721 RepID=UPI003CF105BB